MTKQKLDAKTERIKYELWMRGNLEWKMHAGQKKVYEQLKALPPTVRERVVFISRRWGKTYLGLLMAIMKCLEGPNKQVFIVAPTIKQASKIISPLIQEIVGDAPPGLVSRTKSEHTWHIGLSTLQIGGFDTAIETFRGLKADAIFLEESGMSDPEKYEYIINSVLRPTLQHSRGPITHLTTPALELGHPLHLYTIPRAKLNSAFFTYSIYDNPLLLPEEIEAEIEIMGGVDSPHVRRELFCELIKDTQTLIIPEFDQKVVTDIKHVRHAIWLTAIDFGGARDKTSIITGFYDFKRAKTVIVKSTLLEPNTGTNIILAACGALEHEAAVVWKDNMENRVCDAAGQTHVDIQRAGFRCYLPRKGRDSVEEGINALRVEFLKGNIEIDTSCKDLIVSLESGRWNRSRTDFVRTKELGHCDAVAAMVYFMRHIDRHTNPYPAHEMLSNHTHFIPERNKVKDTQESELDKAFTL